MDLKTALIDLQCELVAERNRVNPKEITWLQYDILYQLQKEEDILPSQLSRILGTSRSKLSKALRGLKTMGYIEQVPNRLDGRELHTSITEEGKDLLDGISSGHRSLYQRALEAFSGEEGEEFALLASKLSSNLRRARLEEDG